MLRTNKQENPVFKLFAKFSSLENYHLYNINEVQVFSDRVIPKPRKFAPYCKKHRIALIKMNLHVI